MPCRSATRPSAYARSASPAVMPKTQPLSRSRSRSVPVKVIAGCIAIGRAPISVAEASTARPRRPAGGAEAVTTRGVADHLPFADRAGADELGDDVLEHAVGHGEQQQVAGPGDVGRL